MPLGDLRYAKLTDFPVHGRPHAFSLPTIYKVTREGFGDHRLIAVGECCKWLPQRPQDDAGSTTTKPTYNFPVPQIFPCKEGLSGSECHQR